MTADKMGEAYFTADGRLVPEKPTPRAAPAPRRAPTQRDRILGIFDAMAVGEYISPLDPPPGDRRAAHTPFCGKDGRGCVCRKASR